MESRVITPPDFAPDGPPKVLLVDIEPLWLEQICRFLQSSQSVYDLYVGNSPEDDEWIYQLAQRATVIVNLAENHTLCKGFLLAQKNTLWYGLDMLVYYDNPERISDPYQYFVEKEVAIVGSDTVE